MHASEPGLIKLSTEDLPERNRLEAVREEVGKAIIKVDLEPLPGQPFWFDAKLCSLPDLGLATGAISPFQGTLRRDLIDADDLVFNITLSGGRILRQLGREAVVGPGEARSDDDRRTWRRHGVFAVAVRQLSHPAQAAAADDRRPRCVPRAHHSP